MNYDSPTMVSPPMLFCQIAGEGLQNAKSAMVT